MRVHALVASLLIVSALVVLVPAASATVSATVTANPTAPKTGDSTVLTFTKTSNDVGDGAQAGNVAVTFTGPNTGSLPTKAYNFAGGASQQLTWTVQFVRDGTYTFTFADTPTSGTDTDVTFELAFQPPMTVDWTVTIAETADYDALAPQGFTVDNEGNAFVAYIQEHAGAADTGADLFVRAFSSQGAILWSQAVKGSPDVRITTPAFFYDHGGRIISIECTTDEGVLAQFEAIAFNPATGERVQLRDLFTVWPTVPTTCPTLITDTNDPSYAALPLDVDSAAYFLKVDSGRFGRFSDTFDLEWSTTLFSNSGPRVKFGDARGFVMDVNMDCNDNVCRAYSFSFLDGTLSAGTVVSGAANDDRAFTLRPSNEDVDGFFQIGLNAGGGSSFGDAEVQAITSANPPSGGAETEVSGGSFFIGDVTGTDFRSMRLNRIFEMSLDGDDNIYLCGMADKSPIVNSNVAYPYLVALDDGTFTRTALWNPGPPLKQTSTTGDVSASCFGVAVEAQGGLYAAWWDGDVVDEIHLQHYSSPLIVSTAETFANDAVVPTNFVGGGIGGGGLPGESDVGTGVFNFCADVMGGSSGSLFFCGLLFIIVTAMAVGAALASFAPGRVVAVMTGTVSLAMMVFNIFIGLWAIWAAVVLIVLTAGLILLAVKYLQFGQPGGDPVG